MTKVFGHRGASAVRPENTIEAFLEAGRLGADGVELDVRRTSDGALAVHHDAVIAGAGAIFELPVAALPASVPLLAAALDACAGMVVNVEIKNLPTEPDFDPACAVAFDVVAALTQDGRDRSAYLVSSFHLATLDAVRSADPSLATGWLTITGYDQDRAAASAAEHGHRALHPHESVVSAALVDRVHGLGLELNTWTVDDPARARQLAEWGVDAIITNVPDQILAALAP
jgi:glycerophosphoryl diester phosphodiesterase